jgi:peroxiredoxin
MEIPEAVRCNPSWAKNVCLEIRGSQVDRQGRGALVSGFEKSGTCDVTAHEPILVADPVWEAIYGVQWGPRPPEPDLILEDMIAAHINVIALPRPASGLTTNAVIHFMGGRTAGPLRFLGHALAGMRRPNAATTVVVVMPAGAFRGRAGEIQATLGLGDESGPGECGQAPWPLLITEDYGGAWAATFDVRQRPATYLMNARGEFVRRQEEAEDAESLARAMDEHFLEAPPPKARPLRLSVRPGQRAPDAPAEEGGHLLNLHRVRGRPALVTFWQSWSAPCLRELRRLQRVEEEGGDRAPTILAVNGGERPGILEAVRREHRLTFALVPDPELQIARLYRVSAWPTTVSIDPEGTVDRIQFGATPGYREG